MVEVPSDNEEFYKSAIKTMLPAMSIDILWIIWRQACRFLDDNRQPLVEEDKKKTDPARIQTDEDLFKLKSAIEDGVLKAESVQSMIEILLNASTGENAIPEDILRNYLYELSSVADKAMNELRSAKTLAWNIKR